MATNSLGSMFLDEEDQQPSDNLTAVPSPVDTQTESMFNQQPALGSMFLDEEEPQQQTTSMFDEQPASSKLGSMFVDEEETNDYQNIDFSNEFTTKDLEQGQLFEVIKDVSRERYGRDFKEGDDKTKIVNQFLADNRFTDFNTAIGTVTELSYIKNASPEAARKSALARRVYENTKSFYEEGGQEGVAPYWDIVKAVATDPLTYAGFGIGKAVGAVGAKAALRGATTLAARDIATAATKKAVIASTITEGAIGATSSVMAQKLDQAVAENLDEDPQDINWGVVGVTGLVSGALSGIVSKAAMPKEAEAYAGALTKEISKRQASVAPTLATAPTNLETVATETLSRELDDVTEQIWKAQGKQIINEIDPAGIITDAKVKETIVRTAVQSAFHIMKTVPEYAPKQGEKASVAISRIIANSDVLDGTAIESSLLQLGIDKTDFAKALLSTASQSGATLSAWGQVGKYIKELSRLDPNLEREMNVLYGKEDEYVTAFARSTDFIKRIERESKVWITSGIDTLMRNISGTAMGVTAKSASQLLEGFTYAMGVGVRDAFGGRGLDRSKKAMADSFGDAINIWYKILSTKGKTISTEAAEAILKFNPSAKETLFSALQETGDQKISAVGRWANTLNVAVDGVYRRAMFTASVEKQLKDVGMDLYIDFLAKDKAIPTAVVKKGMDDALKGTFAYMPKQHSKGQRGLETMFENGASTLISTIEKTPFSSLAIPFPRFMANAMAFQYRYSPLGWLGIGKEISAGMAASKAGNAARAKMLYREANMKFSQGAVGTAAIIAAYQYRKNHQDQDWYMVNNSEGGQTDIRALFPLAPYFAVADWIYKFKNEDEAKVNEMVQTIVGMKLPAGTQNTFLNQIVASFSSEKDADKLAVAIGKTVGDFAGRFTQPFITKQAFDVVDLFREDGSIARDPNVIEAESTTGQIGEAAVNRIINKLPVLKEYLPEAVPKFSPSDKIYREGEVFNRLIGMRTIPNKTPEEKEMIKLQLNPYAMFGASSGDKKYDNAVVAKTNEYILPIMREVMADPDYQNSPISRKQIVMRKVISDVVKAAKQEVQSDLALDEEGIQRIYKMKFNRLPSKVRRFINDEFKARNGMSLEEAGAYQEYEAYKALLQDYDFNGEL